MKSTNSRILGLFTLLIVTASAGVAAAGHGDDRRAKWMKPADANRDGRVDETERTAFLAAKHAKRQDRMTRILHRYDLNRNGALEDGERDVLRRDRAAERFRQLDTNRDGMVSPGEFQAGKFDSHHKHRRGPGRFGGPGRGGNVR